MNLLNRFTYSVNLTRLLSAFVAVCCLQTMCAAVDVTFTVSSNTDDADELSDGTVYVTDGSSFFSSTRVGFRFQNVNIPVGATITSATLEVFSNSGGDTSFSVDLTAQDADNPATFATTANNLTSRPITSAQTLWSTGIVTYTVGQSLVSPNFASSIQEVINRGGWASGNSLVVLTTFNSGDKGIFKRSGSTTYAPRLHISYTVPTVYYVRTDGSDSNSGTGPAASDAWATVAHAATQSLAPGDTVYVQAGTYSGQVAPTVDGTSGNPIRIVADTSGAIFGTAGDVILDGGSAQTLRLVGDNYLEFEEFRIVGPSGYLSAVELDSSAGVVLNRCQVSGANQYGVWVFGSTSNVTIINCLVHSNNVNGVRQNGGQLTILNSTMADNGDDGFEQVGGTATVTNSILANNGLDGIDTDVSGVTHTYNLIFGNGDNNLEGTSPGTGELFVDPLFVGTGKYRLQVGSPAIDAGTSLSGTVDVDLENTSRPIGLGWDMGCYEGVNGGLVGHWKLDETSGTTASDASGSGHDGLLVGSPAWESSAIYGGGLAFDYTDGNDYVELPNSAVLDSLQLGSYTLATWFKPFSIPPATGNDNLSGYGLIKKPSSSLGIHYSHIEGFQVNHYADEGSGPEQQVITASTFSPNKWHHVAMTVDQAAGVVTLYINGEAVGTDTFSPGAAGMDTSTQQWRLGISGPGASNSERPAHGVMDDARIYATALSDSEVAALYDLQGHWKLAESSGTTAVDDSPQDLDGTYQGGAAPGATGPYPGEGADAGEFAGSSGDKVALPTMDVDFSYGLTMSVWYKVNSLTGSYTDFFSLSNGALVDDVWFGLDNNQGLDLFLADTADGAAWRGLIENTGTPATGVWQHAVATIDASGNATLYRNGASVATGYVGLPGEVSRSLNGIGETTFGHTLDGELFDARLYNRPLSAAEVSELYGLVGHWKMDEGAGLTAADSTGFANHAVLNGATWTSDCAGNLGLEFDGAGDTATTSASFDPPETGAISVWLRSAGNPGSRSRPFGVGGDWEIRQEPDGTLSFDLGGEGPDVGAGGDEFITSDGLSFEDRWYHVVAQFDASDDSFEIYIDGSLVHSGVNGDDMSKQLANTLSFGTRTGNVEYWAGGMRDFRVYNRYLSGDEISSFSGLVGLWKLDETSGSIATDSSTNDYHGTLVGSPTWTTAGNIDGALEFESSDGEDRVDVGTFNVSGNEISIAAWVRPEDGTTDQRIIIKADSLDLQDQYWGMAVGDANELDFRIKAGGTTESFTEVGALSPGKWSHVVGTYDGTTMRMYVNGNLIQGVAHSVGGALGEDSSVPVSIGAANLSGRAFDGRLDDVRVYSRLLCDEEVEDIYKGGRPPGVRIIQWVEVR